MIDFFEFSNEMLCVANDRGYFTRVNQAWTKALGWSADELTSRPYIEFVHLDDLEATIREAYMLLNDRHETIRFENRYRCRNGSYRWLAWQAILAPGSSQLVASARDVTEEKLQAQALRESEERFRTLANHAPIGIAQADAEGKIYFVNSKWCDLTGVTPQETTGQKWKNFIHPDDFDRFIEAWQSSLQAGKDMPAYDFRFLHRNGDIRWASSLVSMLKSPDGRIVGQIASVRDVTDRRQTEIALREAEERFRLIALQAPVGISQSDVDGRTFFVNPKLCEIAGAEADAIMGFGWHQFIHPEDREPLIERGRADIASGKTNSSADFRFIRKDGSIRWASSTATIVHDASGKPTGKISITEDITDRKVAEDALRTTESQLRGIVDNTLAVIYLKDLQGRYILTNRRFHELFCPHGNGFVGKTDLEVFPESVARKFIEADKKVAKEQAPLVFEEVAPHDDGPHTYRSVKFPITNEAGKVIAVGGISTDISDLKQAHEALKKKEKLLRNLIEVQENEKQFLCHEFHDGLIQYAAGSLMSLEGFQNTHAATDASEIISTVIGNLRKGVDDGRRAIRGIRPAVLDDSTMEAALHDLIDQIPTSDIMVTFDCDPQIGRLPDAVQTTVYRLVQEALNNARKHSGTDVVRIELRQSNGDLHLEVRDFGCGFDVKSHTQGFGLLGMTERVRLLGGDCSIDSEKDAGTTIKVRLPISD